MKILITLIISIYSISSFANIDYSIKTTARSYPQGLSVLGELGYGVKLWSKSPEEKVLYGYVRPSVSVQTSGLVNYAKAQVELFPVSFLGFYYAQIKGQRSLENLQGFDCENVNCDSNLEKKQFGYKLALAYQKFRLLNFYDIHELDYKDYETTFAEETSNLILAKEDKLYNNISVLGYQLNKKVMIGFLNSYYRSKQTKQNSNMLMGLGTYTHKKWAYQFAVGNFRNRDSKNHLSTLFIITWNGDKGLRLF